MLDRFKEWMRIALVSYPALQHNNTGRPFRILASLFLATLGLVALGLGAFLVAAFLALIVLLFPLFYPLWNRIYRTHDIADEVFFAETEDGWQLPLHFHAPRTGGILKEQKQKQKQKQKRARAQKSTRPPVILCHGIAVNKFGVDLDEKRSLARFLSEAGFAVYVCGLRGGGLSHHAQISGEADYDFDDHALRDVPAIIRRTRELSGSNQVVWIGHSMGAMIVYAALALAIPESKHIAALVSIAGPASFEQVGDSTFGRIFQLTWLRKIADIRFLVRLLTPLAGRIPTPIESILFNRRLVDGRTIRLTARNAIENIPPLLWEQFARWIREGRMTTRDGAFDYHSGMKAIRIPAFFIAGAADRIAPPASVRRAYELIGSRSKTYALLGRENGLDEDYCHCGLAVAISARRDVFPLIADWLKLKT